MPAEPAAAKTDTSYISNPFTVFINSFKALSLNLTTLIGLYLVSMAVIVPIILILASAMGIAATGETAAKISLSAGAVVIVLLLIMVATILQAAYLQYAVATARGKLIGFKDCLLKGLEKALPLLGLGVLIMLIVLVGLVLLIIPGLIFAYWFMFAPYVLIDQNVGIIEALRRSRTLIKGKLVEIGGLGGAGFIFATPTFIPFVGNLYQLVYTPVSQIAWAYRYISAANLETSNQTKPANDPANWWAMLAILLFPLVILLVVVLSLLATQS